MEPASAKDLKSSRTSTIEAGKKPEDGPDGAKPLSFLPFGRPPAYLKITLGYRQAHRYLVNSGTDHIATHSDKFQARGAALPLRLVPIHAAQQNWRDVRECLHIVDDRRFAP